jgi:hypothetical protein
VPAAPTQSANAINAAVGARCDSNYRFHRNSASIFLAGGDHAHRTQQAAAEAFEFSGSVPIRF